MKGQVGDKTQKLAEKKKMLNRDLPYDGKMQRKIFIFAIIR